MNILIFKTDLKTKKTIKMVRPIFNNNSMITKWTVDNEDIDNVLRIEAHNGLNEEDIIFLMKTHDLYCEDLTY